MLLVRVDGARAESPPWPDLQQVPRVGGGEKDVALIASVERSVFVQPIPGANANAEAWFSYLSDGRGTPPDRIKLLRDNQVTNGRLRKMAREAAAQALPGSTLWFVFIGHGAPSPDGKDGLLVGADVQQDADSLVERSVPRAEILEILAQSKAAHVVAIIDACFSGRNHKGDALIPGLQPLVVVRKPARLADKLVVLTASEASEFAGALPGRERPAFSYLALGALRGWGNQGSPSSAPPVTASDVQAYTSRVLRATLRDRTQTPTLEGLPSTPLGRGWEHGPSLASLALGPTTQPTTTAPTTTTTTTPPVVRGGARLSFAGKPRGALLELRGPTGPVLRGRLPWAVDVPPGAVRVRAAYPGHQSREMALSVAAGEARDVPLNLAPMSSEARVQWLRINGGRFMRGSAEGEADERPVHAITLPPFELARNEVTVGQYKACVRDGGCNKHHLSGAELSGQSFEEDEHCNWPTPNFDQHPINCVDWEQARAFCSWVGGRLPTEAEWELAARGDEGRTFAWGEEPPSCRRAVLNDGSPGCGDGGTSPVCSRPRGSTPTGLCDMSGNVWEWVADWYNATGYVGGETNDPWGPATGQARARRGASFSDSPEYLRATNRWNLEPKHRSPGLGFRCARTLMPSSP